MKVNKFINKILVVRKLFAVFWFVVEVCWTMNASQISCEGVDFPSWLGDNDEVKRCLMQKTTTIDSEGITISSKDESMRRLNFYQNKQIKYLPVEVFESFPNLLAYDAANCSLTTITKSYFRKMVKLKSLSLNDNQILMIYSDTFEDLIALEFLYLRKNFFFGCNFFF